MLVASVENLFVALPLREFEGLRLLRLAFEILHRVDSNRPPAHLLIATLQRVIELLQRVDGVAADQGSRILIRSRCNCM